MQNRGSAIAFLFIALIMCLGMCMAVSVLVKGSGRNVIALETLTPRKEAQITATGSIPVPTDTPAETPTPHSGLSTPFVPTATPIPPPTATPPPKPTPTPSPAGAEPEVTPTRPSPVTGYEFRVARREKDCGPGQRYIRGQVLDVNSHGLPGVNVHLYNNLEIDEVAQSKGGVLDMGAYDFPLGPDAARFYVEIVDASGRPLSAPETVDYSPGCTSYVDWQRAE